MEYGDKTFKGEKLYLYQGFDPANANVTNKLLWSGQEAVVNQRDADILFIWKRVFSDAIEALRVSYKKMNPFCVPFRNYKCEDPVGCEGSVGQVMRNMLANEGVRSFYKTTVVEAYFAGTKLDPCCIQFRL